MTPALRWVLRRAWRHGVVGGSQTWVAAGGAALLVMLGRRAWKHEAEVVFSEVLEPGQSLFVSHHAAEQ